MKKENVALEGAAVLQSCSMYMHACMRAASMHSA
jgi:hypothetical protein